MAKSYRVIGLMSGTSMDGVDLAYCEFEYDTKWNYKIHQAKTYSYSQKWQDLLENITDIDNKHIEVIHKELGAYYGRLIQSFCQEYQIIPDFISSHGHTVFHEPDKGITLQIGSGQSMARLTHLVTINDFRSRDVKLGGQGAPLVPLGDQLLFPEYDCCLNLGGFSNISFEKNGKRMAYDVCPVNIPLNELSRSVGKPYDNRGQMSEDGDIDQALLEKLNDLEYYKKPFPKSLGAEWYQEKFKSVMAEHRCLTQDYLRTITEHIAIQIGKATEEFKKGKMLITGGGVYNDFLISRIKERCKLEIVIPNENLVEYKEAMIFAFLGSLRMLNKTNVLSSVTGASKDHCSGVIHNP